MDGRLRTNPDSNQLLNVCLWQMPLFTYRFRVLVNICMWSNDCVHICVYPASLGIVVVSNAFIVTSVVMVKRIAEDDDKKQGGVMAVMVNYRFRINNRKQSDSGCEKMQMKNQQCGCVTDQLHYVESLAVKW